MNEPANEPANDPSNGPLLKMTPHAEPAFRQNPTSGDKGLEMAASDAPILRPSPRPGVPWPDQEGSIIPEIETTAHVRRP
jgi:hypothetical protein